MAAIPTLWTSGAFTNFTQPGGTLTDVSGEATPSDSTVDSMLLYTPAITEVLGGASTDTVGSQVKTTIAGGLETGSKVRAYINYVDANNNYFAELEKGGVTVFADLADDVIRLKKTVGGSVSPVSGDTPLGYLQSESGHLRHYTFTAGDTLTAIKVLDQYIVKASLTDPLDGLHVDDLIILHETDGSATAVSEQIAVELVGLAGTHTNTISSIQGGTITAKFTATTGSNSNQGSYSSPYLTMKKLHESVAVNQIGFTRSGTYNEGIGAGITSPYNSTTLANGTSWEDAPLFLTYGTETVTQTNNNLGCYYIKATSTLKTNYRYFYNWTMDGLDAADKIVHLWGQQTGGAGHTSKRTRWQRMIFKQANGSTNVSLNHGVFSGTITADDYDQYHHFIDCENNEGNRVHATLETHGFYIQCSRNLIEYSKAQNNTGDGMKFFFGTAGGFGGVPVVNNNLIRFYLADSNQKYGIILSGGSDNYAHSCIVANSTHIEEAGSATEAVGLLIGYGAIDNWAWNIIAYGNEDAGIQVEGIFGAQVTGAQVVNCTSYGNGYGFGLKTTASPSDDHPHDTTFVNCSAYGNTTSQFRFTDGHVISRTNIRTTGLKWTASASGTSEYYLTTTGDGDPSIADPTTLGGVIANGTKFAKGTLGSLATANWGFGDNDTLGFSTVYARLADSADPDSKADGFVKVFQQANTYTFAFMTNHETTSGFAAGSESPFATVFGDPLFNDAPNHIFRLNDASPLTGAGTDPTSYIAGFSEDFDRRPSPQTGGPNIGAFEYPDPPIYVPVITMPTTLSTTPSTATDLSCVVTDADTNLIRVIVNKTGSMTVTAPTPSGSGTVKGFG